ncbi:hypothetical protein OESDEN_24668 [Oesophagostomum dentatum]|uniref:Uncharacterized protein n=1 Tax=Oesophagostomum dentatum TaxID=61180 RepID=A0A0B1RVQ2_OESDE|nr:hypothetical protein OESDEN_24668 [Oesophagostomum dentatum]
MASPSAIFLDLYTTSACTPSTGKIGFTG